MAAPAIRIGTAGWDYPDWRGVVYPRERVKGFDELAYLARFFDTVEINSTFYRPAAPRAAEGWARRVAQNPRFKFTAKLWKRFTHERTRAWTRDEQAAARAPLDTLRDAGRLGAVLLQFPWSFKRDAAAREWLRDVLTAFADLPLVVEVRHATWNSADALAELTERGVGLVNVDQPLFANSIAPAALSTSSVGYVRLHGRNYQAWFRKNAGGGQRYDYLYSADELHPWVARIREIAARPTIKELFVVANNHMVGKAPTNASMIDSFLRDQKVAVPPTLFARYHDTLAPYAFPAPEPEAAQAELFGR